MGIRCKIISKTEGLPNEEIMIFHIHRRWWNPFKVVEVFYQYQYYIEIPLDYMEEALGCDTPEQMDEVLEKAYNL